MPKSSGKARKRAPAKPKSQKSPGRRLSLKARLWLILLVIVLFVAGAVCLLHFTGIMTVPEMLYRLGLRDKPAKSSDVQVHFIDIGQGDSTLVVSDGEVMLIDTGPRDDSDTLIMYLARQNITRIDTLVLTHPHADHIGEVSDILRVFDVGEIIMPRVPEELTPATKTYERMLKTVRELGLTITPASDRTIKVGRCTAELIVSRTDSDRLNNYSTLVKVVHGDNSFLIAADAEVPEETDLIEAGADLRAKVLKVGHHGANTSSSIEFLDAVLPRYGVVSCGRNNDYGHPHRKIVYRLKKYVSKLYVTAQSGTVVFTSDGEGLSISTEFGGEEQ